MELQTELAILLVASIVLVGIVLTVAAVTSQHAKETTFSYGPTGKPTEVSHTVVVPGKPGERPDFSKATVK